MNRLVRRIAKFVRRLLPARLFELLDPIGHGLEAWVAAAANGFPAKHLKIIGVTGTNGKTTTCLLIASVLKIGGFKVGLSTTALYRIGDKEWNNPRNVTVTDPWSLQRLLRRMANAGMEWAVVEVTSHALHQNRVATLQFDVAVLTNISQDHLDYHKTMESYIAAKAKLFQHNPRLAVLNQDEPRLARFDQYSAHKKVYYGFTHKADVWADEVMLAPDGTDFKLISPRGHTIAHLNLPGQFNVANALAAAAVGEGLGISRKHIAEGLSAVKGVPGRMERVEAGQPFNVIVDYAVTPDSLEKLFMALNQLKGEHRLIAVYGATGKRDKTKRPIMGEVGAKLCDFVVLTDDEPYTENAADIRKQVEAGLVIGGGKRGQTYTVVPDRREAIKVAFDHAHPGDIVVLTGIGHQHYRTIGTTEVPWDERAVALELLKQRN